MGQCGGCPRSDLSILGIDGDSNLITLLSLRKQIDGDSILLRIFPFRPTGRAWSNTLQLEKTPSELGHRLHIACVGDATSNAELEQGREAALSRIFQAAERHLRKQLKSRLTWLSGEPYLGRLGNVEIGMLTLTLAFVTCTDAVPNRRSRRTNTTAGRYACRNDLNSICTWRHASQNADTIRSL